MTPSTAIIAPHVRCYSGKQDAFVQFDSEWRRLTPEDAARSHTGVNRETHEPSVGIYIVRRPNGLFRIGFDLWRIGANLRPSVIERLENCWRQESMQSHNRVLD